jgi:LysM repeat protein
MTSVSLNTQSSVSSGGSSGSSPDEHVVKAGESLSGIAAERGVSLDALIRANPQIVNPNLIRPGQAIALPPGGGEAQSYRVADGDNLSSIGEKFGVTWQALAQANHLSNPNLIHVGQELLVPGRGATPGRTETTPSPSTSVPAGATGQATGALPATEGLNASQKYELYASYVNSYGGAEAKADLAAGRQVILGLRDETAVNVNGGKGAYDDRIVVLQASGDGGSVKEFSASTEPSSQYDGRYGADFNGDGRLELGRMAEGTVSFQKSHSGNLGDVLRPTGSLGVERDTNHDGQIDARDPRGKGQSTDNSFLFHAGGNTNTGSAGCQTLKPGDFQSFWNGLGDQKTFNYVLVNVDHQGPPGAPTTSRPAPAGGDTDLGALSEQYETGGRGPGTVSSGTGDPGGVSYGTYQLAGNLGRPQQFLANEGRAWAAEFGGAGPGSASFTATWKEIAAREPEKFEAAQHAYIERTHYDVQVSHVQGATGLDLSTRSPALKDVAWSTSVQHGPETNAIVKAMTRVEAQGIKPSDGQTYDRTLINAIYDERGKRDASGALAYFTSASAQVQASVATRFGDERRDALAMLGQ